MSMSYLRFLLIFAALLMGTAVQSAPDTTVAAGKTVILSYTVSGTPPFASQWIKDGTVLSGATNATYTIASFSAATTGVYSVQVSNSAGSTVSDTVNLLLPVNIAPVITTQPASQSITVGKAFTLAVVATGTPTPTYQWSLNGVAIPGATSSSYTLTATAAMAGDYRCVVSNSAGSVTSAIATLTVVTPPSAATLKVIVQ